MKLFTPPESNYSDSYNQEKYKFVWRVFILLCFVFSTLSVFHAFRGESDAYITLGALAAMIISLLITAFTGKYGFAAVFAGIAGTALCQIDLYFIVGSQKYVTILWIIATTLYVFYLLGAKWGFVALLVNMTGLAISLFVVPKNALIRQIEEITPSSLFAIVFNLIVITFFITYLMHQILKTSRIAEKQSLITQKELKHQYEIVQAQHQEKSVMLREIHHRVKNNLQVITSLLRMQSREIEDQKTLDHFQEAINRVAAMALIHEKMYGSKDISKINLKTYLSTLAEEILKTYRTNCQVQIHIKSEIDHVQPKSLVSTALIFNELITNSIKHGFKDRKEGEIRIDIKKPQKDSFTIDYRDNGEWVEKKRKNSFGIELIQTFTEQLNGSYTFEKDEGTHYHFTFQLDDEKIEQ